MGKIHSPWKCAEIVHKSQFLVSAEFTPNECEGYSSPLMFYSKFSRFPVALINKEKKSATANIRLDDFADIKERSMFAYKKELEMKMSASAKPEQSSPAYTVVMAAGKLKGKTPAQLLIEDAEGNMPLLNNQYKWIKDNLEANPKFRAQNQKQLDAIMDASRLYKEGKLDASMLSGGGELVIYEQGMRPLIRRKREDGKCFVYEMKVMWQIGDENPVDIMVENFYAPVIQTPQGLLNVQASQKSDVMRNSMRASAKEWMNVIYRMEANMRVFENMYAAKMYQVAVEASKANRAEANIPNP